LICLDRRALIALGFAFLLIAVVHTAWMLPWWAE
jgi:hypothetical protein